MMKFSRSCILIRLICLLLAVDIILLACFSGWLVGAHGRLHKIFLAGIIITSCFVSLLLCLLRKAYSLKVREDLKIPANRPPAYMDMEADADFLKSLSGLPTQFSFTDLESATNAFTTKLGHGGFGSVYAGTLPDGTKIAAKRLEKEGHGHREFCAEVATISKIRHANLVSLKGFCAEGAERILVYEYMPGGSLDRWIFHSLEESQLHPMSADLPSSSAVLNWDTRHSIAFDIARGLAYLHEECDDSILHLDVKPQNILLDESFHAKVSDFGLSRSMDKAQSRVMTGMRGTPGYLAPEWLTGGGIDVKTDVYGYGMVVLELISGRRSVDQSQENIEDWFLPAMAFKKLKDNHALDVIDRSIQGQLGKESCKQALQTIKVALWCIQEDAAKRPSMGNVVRMLEGQMEVMEPPVSRNFLASRHNEIESFTSFTIGEVETLTLPR